jgi:hypothetical protein
MSLLTNSRRSGRLGRDISEDNVESGSCQGFGMFEKRRAVAPTPIEVIQVSKVYWHTLEGRDSNT